MRKVESLKGLQGREEEDLVLLVLGVFSRSEDRIGLFACEVLNLGGFTEV